jgi:hypothetical protein
MLKGGHIWEGEDKVKKVNVVDVLSIREW